VLSTRFRNVPRANVRAKAAYRPRPGGGRLTFFHPRASPEPTNGWPALAGEPIEVHEMAADHDSMLVPPAVTGLADRLRSWFERSLDAAPNASGGSPAAFAPQAAEIRS
jgi:thioesterase domain-containing protein